MTAQGDDRRTTEAGHQVSRRNVLLGMGAGAAVAGTALGPTTAYADTPETGETSQTAETGETSRASEVAETGPGQAPDVRRLFAELVKEWPANRTINLVYHGHSVPAGYHATPRVVPFESYPFMVYQGMNARFGTAVMNTITTAIGGENALQGAARFRRDVLGHRPDLVFVDYAINDQNLTLEQMDGAWRDMIRVAWSKHVPLVLITPTGTVPNDLGDPDDPLSIRADLIRRLGRETGLPVADVSAAWQAVVDAGTPKESLLSQYYHPNKAGHEIAAKEILRTLDAMRAESAPPP